MHAHLERSVRRGNGDPPLAADLEPSDIAAVRILLREQVIVNEALRTLEAIDSETCARLAVAVVLVRALAVILYSVDSVGQLKGQTVARQIDRSDVLAGERRGNRAVREHEIFRDYAGQVLRAPLDAELDAVAELLRLYRGRAHHAFRVLESVKSDKGLDPLERHLSHTLVVRICAGELRTDAAVDMLDSVLLIRAELARLFVEPDFEVLTGDDIAAVSLRIFKLNLLAVRFRGDGGIVVFAQNKLLARHYMTRFERHYVAAQNKLAVERALALGFEIERHIDNRLFEIALVGKLELCGVDKLALLAQLKTEPEVIERGEHEAVENGYLAALKREIRLLIALDDFIIVRVGRAVGAENAVEGEVRVVGLVAEVAAVVPLVSAVCGLCSYRLVGEIPNISAGETVIFLEILPIVGEVAHAVAHGVGILALYKRLVDII